MISRGVTATLTAAQSATGTGAAPNDLRLPMDFAGARLAWQTITTGVTGTPTFALQGSLDGTNWFTLDTSTAIAGELRIVLCQGIMALRFNVTVVGTAGTVTALVRLQ